MAARSIWNGNLKIGSKKIPVRLYAAVEDRTIHFHLLDAHARQRVKQHMVNPNTGKEVPPDEVRKAYEVKGGRFVVLDEKELESIQPKPSRDIEVAHFVPPEHIGSEWYERPYYVGPNGDAGAYSALAEALDKRKREGFARWAMRGREYIGALRAIDGHLLLITLRFADEVLSARDLPRPAAGTIDKREIQMAEQLVSMLQDEFRPEDFHDEYRERVMKFIEQKARGQKPKLAVIRSKQPPTRSLADVLAASLNSVRKEKAVA